MCLCKHISRTESLQDQGVWKPFTFLALSTWSLSYMASV